MPGAIGWAVMQGAPQQRHGNATIWHAQPAPGRLHSLHHIVQNNKRKVDPTLSTKKRSASGMPSTTSPCRSSRVDCSRKSVTWQRSRTRQAKAASE